MVMLACFLFSTLMFTLKPYKRDDGASLALDPSTFGLHPRWLLAAGRSAADPAANESRLSSADNVLAIASSTILACTFLSEMMIKVFDECSGICSAESAEVVLGYRSTDELGVAMIVLSIFSYFTLLLALQVLQVLGRIAAARARYERRHVQGKTKLQIRNTVACVELLRHPAVFIPFEQFMRLGRLMPYEKACELDILKTVRSTLSRR
jgi:hypothetical protein